MADRLTQLQDCLDQLLIQMNACVRYLESHHPPSSIPGQPDLPGAGMHGDGPAPASAGENSNGASDGPDSPELFQARMQELASDLVFKEQQIEALISVLPGVGSSSAAQEARMQALDTELRAVEVERQEAVRERERLLARVDEVVVGLRRP